MRSLLLAAAAGLAGLACKSTSSPPGPAIEAVPQTDMVTSNVLSAPVDVVRDEWGIPHIYGQTLPDVSFADGYVMAWDRLLEMDLGRRQAEGTLSELFGALDPALIDADIKMRLHHLKATAQLAWTQLQSSKDPGDQTLVKSLTSFAAGVNAFIADAKSGKHKIASEIATFYDVLKTAPWAEVDSLSLGYLQAFQLAFDADSEINFTAIQTAETAIIDGATDPNLLARKGIAKDLLILAPFDPTYTLPSGWTGMDGDTSTARRGSRERAKKLLALLQTDQKTVRDVGNDHVLHAERGSNNWIIGPELSTTGHTLVANDTHLSLSNPPVFYLVHLVVGDSADVMGVNFPGIPGIVLGNNRHVAWGATVNNIDVTDVYQETVVPCASGGGQCVMFNGQQVQLAPRTEVFNIGGGAAAQSETVTFYDVPHHGPIIPRIKPDHTIEPLGSTELSIRYTGHEPAQLIRALLGVSTASTMKDAVAALDRDFKYGGQNWVVGDDQGNFGWTEVVRVPRRAAGHAPWAVLPGDGSAEWGPDMDPKYIPHAYKPKAGFIATANNDPIGVTDKNDPFFSQPVVDGSPLYLGWDYDPGTRVGRITKRISAATAGGKKLSPDDLQSIQADAVSEWHPAFQPTLVAAASALADEIGQAGAHPELTGIVAAASAMAKSLVPMARDTVKAWTSFDTPSGFEDSVTPQQLADSRAVAIEAVWLANFAHRALDDELTKLAVTVGTGFEGKLLAKMCTAPQTLATGISATTGDSVLFDDLSTPQVESKIQIAAQALIDALDFLAMRLGSDPTQWKWGSLHTLTLSFLFPDGNLDLPPSTDPQFAKGYPRHGDNGTVDVGAGGLSLTSYSYAEGPAIRFVCDLDPAGPHARNVLPGGEISDPSSPHFGDQWELWRKNKTFDLAYTDSDVLASAQKEYAAHKNGRIAFRPQ